MKHHKSFNVILVISILLTAFTTQASAQNISTEERFDDMFVTAGYGTALGASLGAALLSFRANPDENLKQVAIGASIGFITGSLLGSYVVFSPVFLGSTSPTKSKLASLSITPIFEGKNTQIGVKGEWLVARF